MGRQLHGSHFFQNSGTFCVDFYWKYHNSKNNEILATVFLKWMDFSQGFFLITHSLEYFPLCSGSKLRSGASFRRKLRKALDWLYSLNKRISDIQERNRKSFSPLFSEMTLFCCIFPKKKKQSSLADSKQMNCQVFFRERITTMKCAFSSKEKLGNLESYFFYKALERLLGWI